jgi:hypothetical protein
MTGEEMRQFLTDFAGLQDLLARLEAAKLYVLVAAEY